MLRRGLGLKMNDQRRFFDAESKRTKEIEYHCFIEHKKASGLEVEKDGATSSKWIISAVTGQPTRFCIPVTRSR